MVKIRLRRMGAKKAPFYRVVVAATGIEFSIFAYHLAPDYDFRQDILSFVEGGGSGA